MSTCRLCAFSSVLATATATSVANSEGQRAAAHQLREILPVDVLHGDEEEAVDVAGVVDADHARIDGGEVCLQLGAAAFGFDGGAWYRRRWRAR